MAARFLAVAEGQTAPWVLLTDLAPAAVGVVWYGLRVWIELGFKVLKSMGWQWQQTQRDECERVARHWLVLALATRQHPERLSRPCVQRQLLPRK